MLACFFGHKHIATLVCPALLACTVWELALVAVRTLGEAGRGQEVVAAAFRSPLFGVAPFRIRHCSIPFKSSAAATQAKHAGETIQAARQNYKLVL
jgi:hypothetical protein